MGHPETGGLFLSVTLSTYGSFFWYSNVWRLLMLHRKIAFGMSLGLAVFFLASCASTTETVDPNFLGNYPPRELETIMGNTLPQNSNEMTPREFELIFYPNGNAVEMNYRAGMNSITINLMQKDREAMIASMNTYIDEYQSGKLTKENDKKKAYFGKTGVSMLWGLLAPIYFAKNVDLRFEYQLVEANKPYFLIASATTKETYDNGKEKREGANSPANRIAFSPVQCQHLIELLNQEALLKIVADLDAEAAAFDLPAESVNESGATDTPVKNELF